MIRPALALALLCSWLAPAFAFAPNTPAGNWLTEGGGAVIHIVPCGNGYCGAIVGMQFDHPTDPMPVDWQGHPQCGLTIVQTTSVTQGDNGTVWQGVVLDPRNGVSHPALLSFNADGNLVLRGYLLIPLLGKSTTWTAYRGGPILPKCHLPT